MKAQWEVVWSQVALRDLERIVDFIAQDAEANAARTLDRLEEAARKLTSSPRRGRIVPELRGLALTSLRELVVVPWRLVYRVGTRRVLIIGVFDSRRDLELALLNRLTADD
jgi:addiction module RelE/StbE family toxin